MFCIQRNRRISDVNVKKGLCQEKQKTRVYFNLELINQCVQLYQILEHSLGQINSKITTKLAINQRDLHIVWIGYVMYMSKRGSSRNIYTIYITNGQVEEHLQGLMMLNTQNYEYNTNSNENSPFLLFV